METKRIYIYIQIDVWLISQTYKNVIIYNHFLITSVSAFLYETNKTGFKIVMSLREKNGIRNLLLLT